ncbi:hypothetical protein GCM10027275_52720 [Rhabdobacter roseus]|uniref:Glycosyltransferase RgtA/B/C/D-like domain-containing protein n=1 Tax=Rhabdobacter roseus TaxID=1655419 RepID=A0A840U0R5_9BACT|nr:hypothetical protein [Rhabdobacter roseus]MBB5287347.1 hypothetical protein [Rhabdobacter roseus]
MNQTFTPIVLTVLLGLLSFFLWQNNQKKAALSAGASRWWLGLLLVLALLFRLLVVRNQEGNEDTSTWLSCLITIQHDPDTAWTFLNYTDSRPLTVLPLVLASKLGLPMDYAGAQVVSILLWLGTFFLFYRTILLWETRRYALLYTWVLCLFMGTTNYADYVSYNSEHVGVLMLCLATYWYLQNEKVGPIGKVKTLLLGLLLGSLLFAKFQNIPMGLIIGGFCLVSFLAAKDWLRAGLLIVASLLPTLVVNGYFAWRGEPSTFWNNYFWNYFYYSYTNEFSSTAISDRFHPVRLGFFIFRSRFHGLYFIPLLGVLLLAVYYVGRYRPSLDYFQRINGAFASLLLLASVYAVAQSGSLFDHYLLYLLVPFTYLVAWLVSFVPTPLRSYLLGLLLVGAMVQASHNMLTRLPWSEPTGHQFDTPLVEYIKKNSRPADRLVVWGWADRLYVKTRRALGYRMPHSHHLLMPSRLYNFREKIFLHDMEQNQPALFVDAAVPGFSIMENLLKPHDSFPNIAAYIRKNYRLTKTIRGIRVYKRLAVPL